MTVDRKALPPREEDPRPSSLPFDPADLVAMRVTRAQFSRMVDVSRQTVSQWVRQGKITLGPDGKLDPAIAARQVIERTDPERMRARLFRQATASVDELRQRIRALEAEVAAAKDVTAIQIAEAIATATWETGARWLDTLQAFADAIADRFDEVRAAREEDRLEEFLEAIADEVLEREAESADVGLSPESPLHGDVRPLQEQAQ